MYRNPMTKRAHKGKKGVDIRRLGFLYITLPLFLFMAAYRAAECYLHKKLDGYTIPSPEKSGEKVLDTSTFIKECEDDSAKLAHEPVPLEKTPVKTEIVPPEIAGEILS